MAVFNKFEVLSEDIARKVHDFNGDTLRYYASNTTPSASLDAVKADLAEITIQNGYAGGIDAQNAVSRTGGVTSVTGVDGSINAAGGSVGPFRYIPLFNDTPAAPADPLIGYWDYGTSITLADGESFLIDVGASLFTLT